MGISPVQKIEELKKIKTLITTSNNWEKIKIKLNRLDLEKTSMSGAMNVGNHMDTQNNGYK